MKKCIILGVSGGIAAYKSIQLTSNLIKKNYDVEVIMTNNACEFVKPLSFEALTNNSVFVDTFEKVTNRSTQHISLATKGSIFVVAPASANVIAKLANGIADDMLTTTFLAYDGPKLIVPAMNTNMYNNPITQRNINILKEYGIEVMDADNGYLACGTSGIGRMPDVNKIEEMIEYNLCEEKMLKDLNILISAGPTREPIDPIRYITNHSTGKMGYAIAKAAIAYGANVTLVTGPTELDKPALANIINISTANEMAKAIEENSYKSDIIIMAAAVSDYRASEVAPNKIKKHSDELVVNFTKNKDILLELGTNKTNEQVICGFAMETENLIDNATSKCLAKHADMIVANNLFTQGAGFATDTNVVTLITPKSSEQLEIMSKDELAKLILNKLFEIYKIKEGK
ncbi:MAG: bifunctional phosphopantothenoylcysteine decarboxylase/phosphopantothenate--cysteine ligase CoaBC [Erysipelotrichaceae bacterium]